MSQKRRLWRVGDKMRQILQAHHSSLLFHLHDCRITARYSAVAGLLQAISPRWGNGGPCLGTPAVSLRSLYGEPPPLVCHRGLTCNGISPMFRAQPFASRNHCNAVLLAGPSCHCVSTGRWIHGVRSQLHSACSPLQGSPTLNIAKRFPVMSLESLGPKPRRRKRKHHGELAPLGNCPDTKFQRQTNP